MSPFWRGFWEAIRGQSHPRLWCLLQGFGIGFAVAAFLGGCSFVSEGTAPVVEEPETVAGPHGCAIVGCANDAPGSSSDEAGATESSSEEGGGDTSTEGPSGASESSDDGSTGTRDDGMYGPCDDLCGHPCPGFFDGELCTEMCITNEDCPDAGVCNAEFYFCVELCETDGDCREGSTCQIHDGLEIEFCVWPEAGGSSSGGET